MTSMQPFSVNNIITKFNFIEENGEMGDANALESYIILSIK
jgi:hypothetical protein